MLASIRDQCVIFHESVHLLEGGGAVVLNIAATGDDDRDDHDCSDIELLLDQVYSHFLASDLRLEIRDKCSRLVSMPQSQVNPYRPAFRRYLSHRNQCCFHVT